jgi:ribonuclease HI
MFTRNCLAAPSASIDWRGPPTRRPDQHRELADAEPRPQEVFERSSKSDAKEESVVSDHKQVAIYTDGACLGNPGPGGYGVVLLYGDHRREISGGYRLTTNNRMEMMGAIVGLRALKTRCKVTLYSDSRYLVDTISKGWAERWKKNGWKRNKTDRAVNPDLWEELLELCSKHDVDFRWVPGHAGIPENERCDELSVEAASRKGLPPDLGYEQARLVGASRGRSMICL